MSSPEFSPEVMIDEAVALALAKDVCGSLAKEHGLSMADSVWELSRVAIVSARTRAVSEGFGIDQIAEKSKEQAEFVAELTFDTLFAEPLPRKILDIKPDEMLDPRDKSIPVIPVLFEELIKDDYHRGKNEWSDQEFDI